MVSLRTALIIQNNEADLETWGDRKTGKYSFTISYYKGETYRPLLTSKSIYDSSNAAMKEAARVVEEIKALDLSSEIEELERIVEGD